MKIDPSEVYALRTRKVYIDRILSGEKRIEYRSYKPFYKGLERKGLKYVRFHYQTNQSWIVRIERIDVIKTPAHLKNSPINFGSKVYAIHLGSLV